MHDMKLCVLYFYATGNGFMYTSVATHMNGALHCDGMTPLGDRKL